MGVQNQPKTDQGEKIMCNEKSNDMFCRNTGLVKVVKLNEQQSDTLNIACEKLCFFP